MEKVTCSSTSTSWTTVDATHSYDMSRWLMQQKWSLLPKFRPWTLLIGIPWIFYGKSLVGENAVASQNFTTVDPDNIIFQRYLWGIDSYDMGSPILASCQNWSTRDSSAYFILIAASSQLFIQLTWYLGGCQGALTTKRFTLDTLADLDHSQCDVRLMTINP